MMFRLVAAHVKSEVPNRRAAARMPEGVAPEVQAAVSQLQKGPAGRLRLKGTLEETEEAAKHQRPLRRQLVLAQQQEKGIRCCRKRT